MFYTFIGGFSAVVDLLLFLALLRAGLELQTATWVAFFSAAFVNYLLSIKLIFRHQAKYRTPVEPLVFLAVVSAVGLVDMWSTRFFVELGFAAALAKSLSTAIGLVLNFAGRRFIVFPDKVRGDWKPQNSD